VVDLTLPDNGFVRGKSWRISSTRQCRIALSSGSGSLPGGRHERPDREETVFAQGNTGKAVRAAAQARGSSNRFESGEDLRGWGLGQPRRGERRAMAGADVVIAVDISPV